MFGEDGWAPGMLVDRRCIVTTSRSRTDGPGPVADTASLPICTRCCWCSTCSNAVQWNTAPNFRCCWRGSFHSHGMFRRLI